MKIKLGDTFTGFKFESHVGTRLFFNPDMEQLIGKKLTVREVIHDGESVYAETESGVTWSYPVDQVIAQLKAKKAHKKEMKSKVVVGAKIKGFKYDTSLWADDLSDYVGKNGVIKRIDTSDNTIEVCFEDGMTYWYPIKGAWKHLIEGEPPQVVEYVSEEKVKTTCKSEEIAVQSPTHKGDRVKIVSGCGPEGEVGTVKSVDSIGCFILLDDVSKRNPNRPDNLWYSLFDEFEKVTDPAPVIEQKIVEKEKDVKDFKIQAYAIVNTSDGKTVKLEYTRGDARETLQKVKTAAHSTSFKIVKLQAEKFVR